MCKIMTPNRWKLLGEALLFAVLLAGVTAVLTAPTVALTQWGDTFFHGLYDTETEAAAKTGPGQKYGYFSLRGRGTGWFVYTGATPTNN